VGSGRSLIPLSSPSCDDGEVSTPILSPPSRPPLERAREGRTLAGVTSGVAAHLGIPVKIVRVGFVLATFAGGAGAVLYCWLWALMPVAAQNPGPPPKHWRIRADVLAGFFLVAAAAVLLASRVGWNVDPSLVLPLLIVAAGAVIAYAQFDDADRARWFERTGMGSSSAIIRLSFGGLLVVLGVLLLVVKGTDFLFLGRTLLAAIAVLGGAGLVLAPWGVRAWRDLDLERAARARESERADIAAHLHDSVLQTLALIQHRSPDGSEASRLARAQERDLRGWIYGAEAADPTTMAARVTAMTAEIEDVHAAVIEVVTVGDRTVDDRTRALLAALREAVLNAVRHAGGAVRVYVESSPAGVEAFVRDRGPGFELSSVPEDRLGVKESIIGRMERHGGEARVRSTPGEGTEVRLWLPDEKEET
jgi:signal transduction histidine kinase/phage shock protein PspC (stress-responsive transcriptional regulator)